MGYRGRKMPKRMLINATEKEESRVAVVDERGLLENLIIESSARGQIKGNIYKAVIVNVDPGLEAAFIDYGSNRHGFLPLSDVQQKYYNSNKEVPPQKAHEYLKKGQEILVQAEREEVMHKGAVFTTFLSLPGRFMVVMPESTGGGISRKIEDENDRKTLKETIKVLKNDDDNIAIIIRTAGVGHDDQSLKDDYQDLVKEYKNILQLFQKKKGPGLIFEDLDMTIRCLRDYFSKDIEEVYIDSFTVYKKAIEFFRRFMPEHLKCVKQYREKRPLFARFNIESQIEQMFERMSPLPSGGTICIDPTEALISIDVNSGGAKSEEGQEMLAFQTNVEAAVEVARQLRLRNLGGLVVIDFIDMANLKFRKIVERVMQAAVKKDKARIEISPIGKFGLMEMSRQRIKANFGSISKTPCLACEGKGFHRAVPIAASSVLRKITDLALSAGPQGEVRVDAPANCANYLLNDKRHILQKIETENNISVKININDNIHAGYETIIVNSRKSLEEEEKRESIAKERKERSSSKIGGDKYKKPVKISWKIGNGIIEANELPLSTQEILNEHFYDITNQKPPVVEEAPAFAPPPTTGPINDSSKFSRNKKFKKKIETPEETFQPLAESFNSFEIVSPIEEVEAYETFSEVVPTFDKPDAAQNDKPEATAESLVVEENIEAAKNIPADVVNEKMEVMFTNIESENHNSLKGVVDIKVEPSKSDEPINENNFQSFEVIEGSNALNSTQEIKKPSQKPNIEKEFKKPNRVSSNSISEDLQYLDITHTAKNFGVGLIVAQPNELIANDASAESELSQSERATSDEPFDSLDASDNYEQSEEPDENSNQESASENHENGFAKSNQPQDQAFDNLQQKDRRNAGGRPFSRRRRRFQKSRYNGQRPPKNSPN